MSKAPTNEKQTTTKQEPSKQDASKQTTTQAKVGTQDVEEKTQTNLTKRQEIRSLSDKEQNRFMDALLKMCENKNGVAGTSEYFRLAGYHGLPGPYYCTHGIETFPSWHRIYLREFEKALQTADKALGRDGKIGLPYWDWTKNPSDGLPAIIRKRFNSWPSGLFPPKFSVPSLIRASDRQIYISLISYQVARNASDCMLPSEHFQHASRSGEWATNYASLETPHDSVHGIVGGNGGPMGSVAYAAFDPVFWLHHCNIDRIYAGYLADEPDSQQEFEANQSKQDKNLYKTPLAPFKKSDGTDYYPTDTFHTTHLSYNYDSIPKPPAAQLREPPQLVIFPQVRIDAFESRCYQVHVFIVPKAKETEFKAPERIQDIHDHPNYAGSRVIFGRGAECENCRTQPPFDMVLDVTHKLRDLRLSRYQAVVKVYLVETTSTNDAVIEPTNTPLPKPLLTGPLFEDQRTQLDETNRQNQSKEEVEALQRYLKRFGYYDDEIDGDYGPVTQQAVKDFQAASGLKTSGVADADTKKAITGMKRCSNVDGFAKNKVKDEASLAADYGDKYDLTYSVGVSPGYLKRAKVLSCIRKALDQWEDACAVKFIYVDSEDEKSDNADIWYEWSDHSLHHKNVLRFDGAGGVLGEGGNGFVSLDSAERWVIGVDDKLHMTNNVSSLNDPSTWYRGRPAISLYHTVLHETGHALGYDHSNNLDDVMAPFYQPAKTTLSRHDKHRAAEGWGAPRTSK